jgi:uncharacterized membrane protein YccC
VDTDGNVSYSERKPINSKVEEVKLRGITPVSKEQAQERLDELKGNADAPRKDREFKATVSIENAEREKRLAANCETYRQNLRVLQNATRVKTADGSFLDDKGRAARVTAAQKQIQDNC